jgi:hypothetical protein
VDQQLIDNPGQLAEILAYPFALARLRDPIQKLDSTVGYSSESTALADIGLLSALIRG